MTLFDNLYLKEFLLFIQTFQMALGTLIMLDAGAKIQYICPLLRGEALRQLGMLFAEVGRTTSENVKYIILGLGTYFTC